jgi:hypothetical protein
MRRWVAPIAVLALGCGRIDFDGDMLVVGGDGGGGGGGGDAPGVIGDGPAITMQQAHLIAAHTDTGDQLGWAIALSGDGATLVVGAPYEDGAATGVDGNQLDNTVTDAGAAYVFARNGTSWSQQSYLKASNTGGGDYFGYAVAISGDGRARARATSSETS